MRQLGRLFHPSSIAVVGGGAWCRSVIEQCRAFGFPGGIWPVHPTAKTFAGMHAYRSVDELPDAPDATFIGVNRTITVGIVRKLAERGAGGAVCFASGFREAEEELPGSAGLEDELLAAAGDMPVLGPNCYGFINGLDGALLWPDQHGLEVVRSGVGIVTQSSNIGINITMQCRAVPVAFVVAAGNQAQTGIAAIGRSLLEDDRVTALGLHAEGFGDLGALEQLSSFAESLGKPVVVLKVGRSEESRRLTVSHTASLAGSHAGAEALMARLGFATVTSLTAFLETLKLLHVCGKIPSNCVASVSCSGGEASLVADTGKAHGIRFPALNKRQLKDLRAALGPRVALSNPLDYHTYIWRDTEAMVRAWSAVVDPSLAMTLLVVDFPRTDRCDPGDWRSAIDAAIETRRRTGGPIAMVATLPELMPEHVAKELMKGGVVPLNGLDDALSSVAAVGAMRARHPLGLLVPAGETADRKVRTVSVSETDTKKALAEFGLDIPRARRVASRDSVVDAAEEIGFPVALKAEGHAHKTESGAVALDLATGSALKSAAADMGAESFLVEEMISGVVAELLVGVVRDPAHGFVLTVAAGGTLAEIMRDRQSLLVPCTGEEIGDAIDRLGISRLLAGWRGGPAADRCAIIRSVLSMQDYVLANSRGLEEIEINPLLCGPDRAVAADAFMRRVA